MKFILTLFLLATSLSTTATALPSPTSPQIPSATAKPSGRPRPQTCGGHSPEPRYCNRGLVCAPTQPPGSFDLPGTCMMQRCGGKPNNGICPLGQVCVYDTTSLRTDQPGYCLAAVLVCGGTAKERCVEGWECVLDPRVDFEYGTEFDGAGICIPPGWFGQD